MKLNHISIIVLFLFYPIIIQGHTNSKGIPKNRKQNSISVEVKKISKSCWRLRETNADSALILGFEALNIAEKYELHPDIAEISNYIGAIYSHYLYKYKISIPYFRKALVNSFIANDSMQMAYAYNNLSYVYLEIGNTPLALQYGQLSQDIFMKLNNKIGLAYGYTTMGVVYREQKDFQMSLKYLKMAASIRTKLSPKTRQASALYQIAKSYEDSGLLDSAMTIYHQALSHIDHAIYSKYEMLCYKGIGDIHYSNEEYEQALEHYERALTWNQSRGDVYGIIDSYIGMALIHAHWNNFRQGEKLLNKALNLAIDLGIGSQLINSYNAFIEFYKIQNDLVMVAQSFDTFLSQYDSILTTQQIEVVNEMENNFNMNQDLIKTKEELETNRRLRLRLVMIIILMILIISVLFWQYFTNRMMNKRLQEMNHTKDKLFSVISHDLKNPFNSLIGFSDVLLKKLENQDYKKAIEYTGYLNKAATEGLNLLTNLLHWSMSQSGRIQFKPKMTDLNILFKGLEELFRIEVDNYKLTLIFENTIEEKIKIDPDIVKIILVNLITNALKYTEENGTIQLFAELKKNIIKIKVKDSGIGMSEETINQLFSTVSSVKSRRGLRDEKGTGLGLNIINELLHIHKGKIKVTSQEGIGSTFDLEFPQCSCE